MTFSFHMMFVWVLFLQLLQVCHNYKLESSSIVYRHGDRSPIWIFPTDQHKLYWNFGTGWLTKKGIWQEYKLGRFLRDRYINERQFLNTSYFSSDIIVRSTDIDRTLMSAQSVLAGIFPPNESYAHEQLWNPQINWQPIPIHTVPISKDYLLCAGGACELFRILEKQLWESDVDAIKINEDYKQLFKYLGEKSGISSFNLANLDILVDPLICEHSHNLSLPDWLNTTTLDILFNLHNHRFQINYKYDKMQILGAGTLIAEIVNIMATKIKELEGGDVSDPTSANYRPKFHMYSGHDTTLTAILSIMQGFTSNPSIQAPNYASTVFLELYSNPKNHSAHSGRKDTMLPSLSNLREEQFDDSNSDSPIANLNGPSAVVLTKDYHVKIFYRNSPLAASQPGAPLEYQMTQLKLPGCPGEYCPFETFVALVKDKFPTNIEKQCRDVFIQTYCQKGRSNWAACFILFPIFLIASVILLAWGLILWTIKRKVGTPTSLGSHGAASSIPYMPIPSSDPTPSNPLL